MSWDLDLDNSEHSLAWTIIMLFLALVACVAAITGIFILGSELLAYFDANMEFEYGRAMCGLIHIVVGKYTAAIFYGMSGAKNND